MKTMVIITILFALFAAYRIMYASKVAPCKSKRTMDVILICLFGVLSVAWSIVLISENGWPQSVWLCAWHVVELSFVSMFLIGAVVVSVLFAWILILCALAPERLEKLLEAKEQERPKSENDA